PSGPIAARADNSYTVTGGTCLGASLAPGATCTVDVRFDPVAPTGAKPATLSVTATPGGAPTATLDGTALAPRTLALAPPSLDFGATALGAATAPAGFTVTNTGEAPTGTPTVALSDPTHFTIASTDCAAALAPGASCTVQVAFRPAAVGAIQGVSLTATAAP